MNWLSYKESLSNFSNKQKGDSFERLTQHYLKYDPQYATKLKKVWLLSEVPQNIHEKLNLPRQDQGIDLICETKDGEYWAVQCKYLDDETKSLPWRMLSTFTGLAFGVCKNISFGLVCTTAERFTRVLKQQDNIGFCTGEVWRSLDEDLFTAFTRKRKPKKLKPCKPYAHQRRAIRNSYKHYVGEGEQRGKMIMPCGTGKSLAAFWIAEKLEAKRILVAVPSLALIRQTLRVWLRESYAKGWDVDWITVCSDESVGKISRDDLAVLKQDLGVPAVTDPKIIAKWLRKRHIDKVVVFTTYQSGKAIAQASKLARRNFDLGIMDEAHKTVGSRDKPFSHLLFDKNIKITRRVFMTATERHYAGKKDEVISMDDLDVYGDTFELLSFKEALEVVPPILTDYKIVTKIISKDEVADLVKKRAFLKPTKGKWDQDIEADMLAALIILRKAIRRYKIRHAITFHSSIAKAKAFTDNQPIFTDLFPQYWKTDNFHVSGKMPTSVRARHMEEFEASKRAIMTNARCLTEGVDVPNIDCVLFADPKKSTVDIVQAVGRALRISEGKKLGYVIVPVIIEDEGNFDESDAFQTILMTLRALASNDERIIDYFRARSQNKRTYTNIQIEVDERIGIKINVKDFARELELKLWSKLAKLSWMPFEAARAFVHTLGLKNVIQWNAYCRTGSKPYDLPSNPDWRYNGWAGWGDWLGTFRKSNRELSENFWSYEESKYFVKPLKLGTRENYQLYVHGDLGDFHSPPEELPKFPRGVYKNKGWVTWPEFLDSDVFDSINVYSYDEAKKIIHPLGFKKSQDFYNWKNGKIIDLPPFPKQIPKKPTHYYVNTGQWQGWPDFIGFDPRYKNYMSFKRARKIARALHLDDYKLWQKYRKGEIEGLPKYPERMPPQPRNWYRKEGKWTSWDDFLGYEIMGYRDGKKITFEETKAFVQDMDLEKSRDYNKWKMGRLKKEIPFPKWLPSNPQKFFNEWNGWPDFLDRKPFRLYESELMPFNEVRTYTRSLGLESSAEWNEFYKNNKQNIPKNIPRKIRDRYSDKGWVSWPDMLGYEPKQKKK